MRKVQGVRLGHHPPIFWDNQYLPENELYGFVYWEGGPWYPWDPVSGVSSPVSSVGAPAMKNISIKICINNKVINYKQ